MVCIVVVCRLIRMVLVVRIVGEVEDIIAVPVFGVVGVEGNAVLIVFACERVIGLVVVVKVVGSDGLLTVVDVVVKVVVLLVEVDGTFIVLTVVVLVEVIISSANIN